MIRPLTKDDVADLLGKPFAMGHSGPEAYDCFGVVFELCQRDQSSLNIPPNVSRLDLAYCWKLIELCDRSDVVPTFRRNQILLNELLSWRLSPIQPGTIAVSGGHCGYALSGNEIIHAVPGGGVSIGTPEEFSAVMGQPNAAWRHTGRLRISMEGAAA